VNGFAMDGDAALPRAAEVFRGSPLGPSLADEARRLVAKLNAAQRLWLSGYLAGASVEAAAEASTAAPEVTVLYGSQTGNAERLARSAAAALEARGVACTVLDMMDCRREQLLAARVLLVVVSTQGEGEPPDRAKGFWDLLHGRKAPRLENLEFSVLALGDSSYEKFCATGRQIDARLEALGARRLHPRADCDVDFEETARGWLDAVLGLVQARSGKRPAVTVVRSIDPQATPVASAYTRKNPFHAEVLVNQRLTARGSTKDVRHIELSLDGAGFGYEPGDALGVVPRNDPKRVAELLAALPYDPRTPVALDPQALPLEEALATRRDITGPVDRELLARYARALDVPELARRLERDEEHVRALIHEAELVDVVREYPPRGDATTFVLALRPLAQRLYSIASSAVATPGEVHLTVAVATYRTRGGERHGVVSGRLAFDAPVGAHVPVYLHRNAAFRLPAPDVPIVMIGPGTGVAPFRAFLAEREATGASGRNWLFFGDRCFETDFLYQAEWLAWRKNGLLQRLDVAFSRDQPEKIYVQHRMREHGAELWAWLEEGAHVYVCGDAKRMAPDVHAALREIVGRHGGYDEDRAEEYLTDLQRKRRYQKDVY
jgi:sulfite reductase (NADPH) flavoprotein alpha-component